MSWSTHTKGYKPLSSPTRTSSFTTRRIIPVALATLALLYFGARFASGLRTHAVDQELVPQVTSRPDLSNETQPTDWALVREPLRVDADVEERLRAWESAPL